MATDRFRIKRGDTEPALRRTFVDDAGAAVDLSTASSVALILAPNAGGAPDVANAIARAATIVDASAGIVEYDWQPGDTETVAPRSAGSWCRSRRTQATRRTSASSVPMDCSGRTSPTPRRRRCWRATASGARFRPAP